MTTTSPNSVQVGGGLFAHHRLPDWQKEGAPHLWPPYTQTKTTPIGLPVQSAEGAWITLSDGRRLLDGMANWWTACHGHRPALIEKAIKRQLKKLPHIMLGGFQHEPAARLAARLTRITPGDLSHVFFSESGSVSVEVAMKMALQHWMIKGQPEKHKFLAFKKSYHGDCLGVMSICDPNDGMHSMFRNILLPQFHLNIPRSNQDRLEFEQFIARHCDEMAAIVIEPLVQGAGGMVFHSPEDLAFIRKIADQHGLLLIADEIMTGFGRLGSMFACEQAQIAPDIMTLSKALTGGVLPLAATLASQQIFATFQSEEEQHALMHGPTYMGNPLACAAANASLDLFESEDRLAQVRRIEAGLRNRLEAARSFDRILDVRVRGAIGVIEVDKIDDMVGLKQAFVDAAVWIRPFGNIIYCAPPFILNEAELDQLSNTMLDITYQWFGR